MRGEDIEEQSARSSVYFMTHGSLMFSAVRYEVFCHEKALRAERISLILKSMEAVRKNRPAMRERVEQEVRS